MCGLPAPVASSQGRIATPVSHPSIRHRSDERIPVGIGRHDMKSRFMNTLFGSRRRAGIVVLLWIILVGALASFAPALEDVENNAGANDPPPSSQSVQAAELAAREFPR